MNSARVFNINGEDFTLTELSKEYNISRNTLNSRIRNNPNLSIKELLDDSNLKRKRIKNGEKFNHLTATGNKKQIKNQSSVLYEFICDCGNVAFFKGQLVKNNSVVCCGNNCSYSRYKKHNKSSSKVYTAWQNIKDRCYNKNNPSFAYYGGIGITMDKDFKNDFLSFYNELGDAPTPEHSIDRKDVTKGYIKGNLRWATKKEQANNQRRVNELTLRIQYLEKVLEEHNILF